MKKCTVLQWRTTAMVQCLSVRPSQAGVYLICYCTSKAMRHQFGK